MNAAHCPPAAARKPWPLAGVAVAIAVSLGLYTYVRLHFAKPGKPHEPYAESRERAAPAPLVAAGWVHFEAAFEPFADLPPAQGAIRTLAQRPGIANDLAPLLPGAWLLPIDYSGLVAPGRLGAGEPYTIHFQAHLDRARAQIVGFDLYRKDSDILAVPRWEPLPAELELRDRPTPGRMRWPAGAVPPGRYQVTLLALKQSSQWDLEVPAP